MKTIMDDIGKLVSDAVLIGAAVISVFVAVLDFAGVLDQVEIFSDRVTILTLLGVGFLLGSIALERRSRLDAIKKTLDDVISSYALGAQYLEDQKTVFTELERLSRQANESIMALGARARDPKYFDAIQTAVTRRSVVYYRLIGGTHITHRLHKHLRKLIEAANVQIAWTPKEKFGNITVTENECIIAFPAPYRNRLSGLRLPGETNSRRYSQYFLQVFFMGLPVCTERSVEVLCDKCSPDTAGNPTEIRRIISNELESVADEKAGVQPDLV